MQNLDLNNYGVQELAAVEMRECDGGFVVIAAICIGALLLSSCTNNVTIQVGDNNSNSGEATTKVDSTGNGNSADVN